MKQIHYSLIIILLFVKSVYAEDFESIPHVNAKALNSFKNDYLYAAPHSAFAIAPGGAWSWVKDKITPNEAEKAALSACSRYTQQKCVLYAVDQQITFDYASWYQLWGPYKTKKQAQQSADGVLLGQKFPNIEYTNAAGKKKSIHQLKGKVSFVHFWASWCPSCVYEFPAIMDMYSIVNDILPGQVEFVVLQVRESIQTSKKWAAKNGVEKTFLSDSGVKDDDDEILAIKGGKKIKDRMIAKVFPASYVLDKNGIVVFSNMGSIDNWNEYVNFFKHAAEHSGK